MIKFFKAIWGGMVAIFVFLGLIDKAVEMNVFIEEGFYNVELTVIDSR